MTLIDRFSDIRVLCVGDVMLDRFVNGTVKRISPESPVPVLSLGMSEGMPGGAANVARNVASLGGHCVLVSVVGQDAAARELKHAVDGLPQTSAHMIEVPSRPTTEKVRFVAQGQHLLRTDTETTIAIDSETEQKLLAVIENLLPSQQVLVLSDYAKGVLTDAVLANAIRLARAAGIPCIVDPKSAAIERYAGATLITPNCKEVLAATNIDPTDNDVQAVNAGQQLLERAELDHVLVTRAHKGMTLVSRHSPSRHIPACAKDVFDVVGAGDTVVAALALSLGAGQDITQAAILANAAAGVVVGKRGTATVSQAELRDAIHQPSPGEIGKTRNKLISLKDAKELVSNWKNSGHKVGFTNGCFDILHVGHLSILDFSRTNCDRLIVGVNTDASVKRLKGASRPINNENDRARLLAGMETVDAVVLFDQDTPLELIKALEPDVLVKGADYAVDRIAGAQEVLAAGGKVFTSELIPGRSTSRIIDVIQKQAAP